MGGISIVEPREWRQARWRSAILYGMTLDSIGEAEGLTRERVRQVVGEAWRQELNQERRTERVAAICRLRDADPAIPIEKIARIVGASTTDVSTALRATGRSARAVRQPRHGTYPEYISHGCRCGLCVVAYRAYARAAKDKLAQKPFNQIPHGLDGYRNYRCRCVVCRDAVRAFQRTPKYREQNKRSHEKARFKAVPETVEHGSRNAYAYYQCRCEVCRAGQHDRWAAAREKRRARGKGSA